MQLGRVIDGRPPPVGEQAVELGRQVVVLAHTWPDSLVHHLAGDGFQPLGPSLPGSRKEQLHDGVIGVPLRVLVDDQEECGPVLEGDAGSPPSLSVVVGPFDRGQRR